VETIPCHYELTFATILTQNPAENESWTNPNQKTLM
jgi:hypothetical protein